LAEEVVQAGVQVPTQIGVQTSFQERVMEERTGFEVENPHA